VFSSSYTIPGQSFAAALRRNAKQQQWPHSRSATVEQPRVPAPLQRHQQQETGQSIQAPNVKSSSLNMLKVATAVQEIMIDSGQKKKREWSLLELF
jgi:hypothetical protein